MIVSLIVALSDFEKSLYQQIRSSSAESAQFPLPKNAVSAAELAAALQHLEDANLIYILHFPSEDSPCFEVELSEIVPPANEEL